MASAMIAGQAGGEGRQRSSAASTRARVTLRNSASGSAVTASTALGILGERRRSRLQFTALVEDLDPPLGLLELRVAEARQLDAALIQGERLLEREVAFLELFDDRFQLGDRRFEVFDRRVGHVSALERMVAFE